jgi:Flp pilus assembly protein TadB
MVCNCILERSWVVGVCAIPQTLLSAWLLSLIRQQRRYNKLNRIFERHLQAMKNQCDAGIPSWIAFEHHSDQCDAAIAAMKREQL